MVYTDTIAAIATALSSSGIGIIRIRGFQSRKRIQFIMDIFGMERNGSMKCCFF